MMQRFQLGRELVLAILLIVVLVVFSLLSSSFLSVENFFNVGRLSVETGLIALGMTGVILTGGIDLSVGSLLSLVAVVVGFSYQDGLALGLAILLGLAVGLAGGLFNALFVTRLGLHPLVVTLGTLSLYSGIALVLSGGSGVSSFPHWFVYLGQWYLGPVPVQLIFFAVIAALAWIVLARTPFGRYLYAIGDNVEAARFSGVPVRRVLIALYTAVGLLVAIAAIIYTSRVSSARADAGFGLELDVIAAVVLGGASIYGGVGSIPGTLLGVFFIAFVGNGLLLAGVESTWRQFVIGLILIVAVFVNEFFRAGASPTAATPA